ncbi:MAG TPA: transporter substrate-binding domain-containing protein [Kiritimatiellia bacterium]|nr:transporter substrate-binding domain-containing protein [Kiritimatiellia bacterium]
MSRSLLKAVMIKIRYGVTKPAMLLAVACSFPVFAQNHSIESGERLLRVTGDRNYPPYCFLDNGIPAGFDIDIIRAVAEAVDFKLEIELKAWSDARHRLETGRADVIPGMARIPLREDDYDFTIPTKQLLFDLFVPRNSAIKTLEDARHAAILIQKSGVMYDLIRSEGIITNLIPVADAPEAITMLAGGQYDGAIVNLMQGYEVLQKMNERNIVRLRLTLPSISYCMATRKGEASLVDLLNVGLNIIKAEGTYREIYDKWFGIYEDEGAKIESRYIFIPLGVILILLVLLFWIHRTLKNTIRRHTAELRMIIDLIPHPIYARDRQGNYILANQAMASLSGIELKDIIGKHFTEIHPPENHHADYLQEDREVFEKHISVNIPETQYIDSRGRKRFMQVSKIPFQQKDGKVLSVLCVAVDITELIEAENAVESSRDDLEITLNSIADGVIATNAEGFIIRMNPVAEKYTGISSGEAIGRPIAGLINLTTNTGEPVRLDEILTKAHAENDLNRLIRNMEIISRDGSNRDIAFSWAPIVDRFGASTGMVYVIRDITEENRLNRQLAETQKMESIGRLAGGVAHDFNNLLTGIIGFTELLNISLAEHHECRTYIKGILEASERARDLVQQLLTFSRKNAREVNMVNLHTVIGHVISLLQHTMDRRITISRHLNATRTNVLGDRSQLQNAILNIGVNARDAMPAGGSLTISSRDVTLSATDCIDHPFKIKPGNYIELTVTDTGVGMDKETLNHAFEPFYTTKGKMGGTGLGLAAVYGTIKEHFGYIDISSKPGQGTTIKLGFPTQGGQLIADEVDDSEMADPRGKGTILVVDDEAIVSKILCDLLTSLGYQTMTAVNGRDALSVYQANRDKIDLVVLDMIMPELNGEETYRELKKINPKVKVIICSGFIQDYGVDDLLKLGILDFLNKPFRKSELAITIAKAMANK